MSITIDEGRYDRQELITWWNQDLLHAARVLVVGAGALGNEVMKNLALIGLGHLTVIDLDVVERSNLSRCVFFRETDNGRFKARVVAEAIAELNPDVDVTGIAADITRQGTGWIRSFDLVIGALDNREARVWINQACRKMGLTWIDGAIEGLRGIAKVFPPEGACYECTLGERDREILARRRSCSLLSTDELLAGKVPTTATSSSIIAGVQVQEAIRLLHGQQSPLANAGWMFVGESIDAYRVEYGFDENCLAHDNYDDIRLTEFDSDLTAKDLIARSGFDHVDAIEFEMDLLLSLSCTACGSEEDVGRRIDAVESSLAHCQTCGEPNSLRTSLSLSPDEPASQTPLQALGLPQDDIVTIRSGEQRIHFHLGSTK